MSLHVLKILRFLSLSFLLSIGVIVLWLSSLTDARTLWLKFESCSPHRHTHVSCVCWTSLQTFSTSPFTSSLVFSSLLSSCFTPSASLMSWITNLRISAEELNDHFISETYDENTQESLTEQRFLEDLDHDDAGVRSTISLRTSKTGNYVKLMRKVSMKWKSWGSVRVPPSTILQEEV